MNKLGIASAGVKPPAGLELTKQADSINQIMAGNFTPPPDQANKKNGDGDKAQNQ
jgi:hypothetical protein